MEIRSSPRVRTGALARTQWTFGGSVLASRESKYHVPDRRNKNTRAAGFGPHTMIYGISLGPNVIAGIQLLGINHQFAVKQMQFFPSRVALRRVFSSWRKPDQHADALFLLIGREQLAGNAGRRLFPFWLCPYL